MRAQAFFPFQQKKSSKIEIMRALLTLLLLFSLEFNGITAIPAGQGSLCFNVPPKKKVRASFMNMDIRGKDRFTAGSTHEFKIRLTPPPDQPNLIVAPDLAYICIGTVKRACRQLPIVAIKNYPIFQSATIALNMPFLEREKSAVIYLKSRCKQVIGKSPRFYLIPRALETINEDSEWPTMAHGDSNDGAAMSSSLESRENGGAYSTAGSDHFYSTRSTASHTEKDPAIEGSTDEIIAGDDLQGLSIEFLRGAYLLFENVKRMPAKDFPKLHKYSPLYALYKQAAIGEAPLKPPSKLRIVEFNKWKAWSQLRGKMQSEDSQRNFLDLLTKLHPQWRENPILDDFKFDVIRNEILRGRAERGKLQ